MDIQFYNTLTAQKESFSPLGKEVGIYACGVTVYDLCHIGHARSFYIFSLLNSFLKKSGYKTKFVRNITDIDDKIINAAKARLQKSSLELADIHMFTQEMIQEYYNDLDALGLPKADYEPCATGYIQRIIASVERLIDKGFAYATPKGNVYFDISKYDGYGRLSKKRLEENLEGVRKEVEDDKDDPFDFALWKAAKESEPSWESPWGRGRPGWHIECSVMSMDILGVTFDIHGGGLDLAFPHHENEIAQSEALTGRPFARYWLHHGMVTVDGSKMSKSLGNFVTIKDALKRYDKNTIKLWFLSAHYRSPIDFSDERLKEASLNYEKLALWYRLLKNRDGEDSRLAASAKKMFEGVMNALADDLNTPKALAHVFECFSETHEAIKDGAGSSILAGAVKDVFDLFFIDFPDQGTKEGLALDQDAITLLLDARLALKRVKEYALADRIRDFLSERGIIVEDKKDGYRWYAKDF